MAVFYNKQLKIQANMSKIYLLSVFFLLAILPNISCGSAEIIAQLDQKTQDKQALLQQKSQKYSSFVSGLDGLNLAQSEQIQSYTAAQSAYKDYFNEKQRCDGLKGTQDFLGNSQSLPSCLPAPVGSTAFDVFNRTTWLKYYQNRARLSKIIYDESVVGYNKYAVEATFYARLSDLNYPLLIAAYQKYNQCLAQHSSASNPDPPQCNDLKKAAQARESVYGLWRAKAGDFSQLFLRGYGLFSLTLRDNYNSDQNVSNQYTNQLQNKPQQLKALQTQCLANLANLKTLANNRLNTAVTSKNKVETEKSKINQILASMDSILSTAKTATSAMVALASQLKQFF